MTAIAVLLAGVLLSAVGVAALRSDTASADTVLQTGPDAVLVLADGGSRPAVEGEKVPPGTTVRAGRAGATLVTRGREVLLGGDTVVTVVDGARQSLERGFVMVEAADAPGLDVRTAAATVTAPEDALVRIETGPLTRIGVLRGNPAQVRPTGRRSTTVVPTFYQVQVPAGGLPGAAGPYVLTPDDRYERELAGDLVRADADLRALASRLDAGGAAGTVVLASLREAVPADRSSATRAPASERALGYLIATASPLAGELQARYADVRELRRDGGSWGIVAAIVRASVPGVASALNTLLEPMPAPVLAGGPLDAENVLGLIGADSPPDGGGQEPADTDDPSAPVAPRPQPTGGPQPPPPPTSEPTQPPAPTDPVTDVVDTVVDTVLDLVGTPSPAPDARPTASPVPLLEVDLPLLPKLPLLN